MCEALGYILSSLRSSELAIENIHRLLIYQKSFNWKVAFLPWIMAAYMMVNESERKKQNGIIKKLCEEIEELKRREGE